METLDENAGVISASKVTGTEVYNTAGEHLGESPPLPGPDVPEPPLPAPSPEPPPPRPPGKTARVSNCPTRAATKLLDRSF